MRDEVDHTLGDQGKEMGGSAETATISAESPQVTIINYDELIEPYLPGQSRHPRRLPEHHLLREVILHYANWHDDLVEGDFTSDQQSIVRGEGTSCHANLSDSCSSTTSVVAHPVKIYEAAEMYGRCKGFRHFPFPDYMKEGTREWIDHGLSVPEVLLSPKQRALLHEYVVNLGAPVYEYDYTTSDDYFSYDEQGIADSHGYPADVDDDIDTLSSNRLSTPSTYPDYCGRDGQRTSSMTTASSNSTNSSGHRHRSISNFFAHIFRSGRRSSPTGNHALQSTETVDDTVNEADWWLSTPKRRSDAAPKRRSSHTFLPTKSSRQTRSVRDPSLI